MSPGFRAVAVAHSGNPIDAVAVAPDGRLFAAIQTTAQTSGTTPGTSQIWVYSSYATSDGAIIDEGTLWATIEGVRAVVSEEGVLGLALAPDFATSKLIYVYLTTTDETANQHIRVYRENANGVGEYAGTVQTTLEPATESGSRNGGALTFGVDGCLFVGVGDNNSRWNAQLLTGTNTISSTEAGQLCTQVCLGSTEYPNRSAMMNDGLANRAGKMLRLAVEGAAVAQPGPGASGITGQAGAFSAGLRNPIAATVHPLTGQLYVAERGDTQQSEIDVIDAGSNQGWPCLEGSVVANTSVAACLSGHTASEVRTAHPNWREPIVTHAGNPGSPVAGLSAYTGNTYPADFYGDVFYVLRESAKIYRLDLQPPCFLPAPGGVAALPFHDSTNDGDFSVTYDIDGDGRYDTLNVPNLTAVVQGPDRFENRVLYVAGRTSNTFTDDAMIFRLEYASSFVPYDGPIGRVADACFSDGTYSSAGLQPVSYQFENPFRRDHCFAPGGPCPGQPDGTPCGDDDPCNGSESCQAGVCQHASPPTDSTIRCGVSDGCREAGLCVGGACAIGAAKPDGTSCADDDPCNGLETCVDATCQPGAGPQALSLRSLTLKTSGGVLSLTGSLAPTEPFAPATSDDVSITLDSTATPFAATLDHPGSDGGWHPGPGKSFRYVDRRRAVSAITSLNGKARGATVQLALQARGVTVPSSDGRYDRARIIVGEQCFSANLSCTGDAKKLRCR